MTIYAFKYKDDDGKTVEREFKSEALRKKNKRQVQMDLGFNSIVSVYEKEGTILPKSAARHNKIRTRMPTDKDCLEKDEKTGEMTPRPNILSNKNPFTGEYEARIYGKGGDLRCIEPDGTVSAKQIDGDIKFDEKKSIYTLKDGRVFNAGGWERKDGK